MGSSPAIDDLELDALTEIANIGVGKAATSLREMTQAQVHLSVPRIALITRVQASQTMREREAAQLVCVHQTFEGDLTGRALLIFPESNSLELVKAVAGRDLSIEDIIALEHEALAETGNIILNACLATMANMLRRSVKMSLPTIIHGDSASIFDLAGDDTGEISVLFLYIDFSVRDLDVRGYITMFLDLPALVSLKQLLAEFIERTLNGD